MPFFRRILWRVHFVFASLLGVFAFLAFSFAGVLWVALAPKRLRPRGATLFSHNFGRFMKAILGWRLRVEGLERFDVHPSVFMANHQSNLDVVTFGSIYPLHTVVIGKRELAFIPFFGWFFRGTGNLFIDRSNPERALATIADAGASMRERQISVWMFPEGHRNPKPKLLPLKKGAFHVALASQSPIVPAVCEPISSVLDAKRLLVRPGVLRIRILEPIPTEGLQRADLEPLMARVQAAMQEAFDELSASARPRIG